jgi:hypothetical protein
MITSQVLMECLVSPNESDSNLEPANVVDGLFAIARALRAVAEAIHDLNTTNPVARELRDGFTLLGSVMERR